MTKNSLERRKINRLAAFLLLAAVGLLAFSYLAPQAFSLGWWTVDGGGAQLQNGGFSLASTSGQADASLSLSGGNYTLHPGYWVPVLARRSIYMAVVKK